MFWRKKEKLAPNCLTWFIYSVMLPDKDEQEVTIIGNMVIRNIGASLLTNPLICIRIKPFEGVQLGGKIGALTHTALMIDGTNNETWHYFHENWKEHAKKTGEHWLKPNQVRQLEPAQQITFESEFRIPTTLKERCVFVEGFFYCDELEKGIGTLNNISMNL